MTNASAGSAAATSHSSGQLTAAIASHHMQLAAEVSQDNVAPAIMSESPSDVDLTAQHPDLGPMVSQPASPSVLGQPEDVLAPQHQSHSQELVEEELPASSQDQAQPDDHFQEGIPNVLVMMDQAYTEPQPEPMNILQQTKANKLAQAGSESEVAKATDKVMAEQPEPEAAKDTSAELSPQIAGVPRLATHDLPQPNNSSELAAIKDQQPSDPGSLTPDDVISESVLTVPRQILPEAPKKLSSQMSPAEATTAERRAHKAELLDPLLEQ